jgi:bifunctional non-homologous end joining protein LigD
MLEVSHEEGRLRRFPGGRHGQAAGTLDLAGRPAARPEPVRPPRRVHRKRHFGVTPEPPGTARARESGRPLEFVVQKHRATQLHYDFRLEHRGVMLSWAVPKGPSLDPATKRLAMETEPHPMDYNQFEGIIPEGEYGGGTVMIWDKGVWAPVAQNRLGDEDETDRQLKKEDLKFVLLGEKLLGSWVLVRTRGGRQWLLIKHRDDYAAQEDLTVSKPRSVVSGRSMAEIASAAGASPASSSRPPPPTRSSRPRPLRPGGRRIRPRDGSALRPAGAPPRAVRRPRRARPPELSGRVRPSARPVG